KEKIKVVKQTVLNNFNLIKNNLGNELNRKEKLIKELEANLNELNNLIKERETEENIKEKVETIKKSLKNAPSFKDLINLEKVEISLKDKSEKVLKNIKTSFVKKAEKLMKKENEKFKKDIEKLLATEDSLLKILTSLEQILEEKKSHQNVVKMFEKAEKGFKSEIELLKKYFNKNDEIQNALQYNIQTLTNIIYEIKIEIKEYEEIIVKLETVENKLKNMSGFHDVLQNLETLRNSLINGESKKQVVIKLESLKTSFEKNKEMFMEVIRKNMQIFNRTNYYLNNVEKEKYKKYQNKWKIPVLEDFDLKLLENENLKDFVINLKQYSFDLILSFEKFPEIFIKKVYKNEFLNVEKDKLEKLFKKVSKQGRKGELIKYLIKLEEIKNIIIKTEFIEANIM
ncbi:hypothetical protein Mgra_00003415, partial [Meloidogyne graminicola]